MTWTVRIHPLVLKEDFEELDLFQQRLIARTIRKKLTHDPEGYGSPLSGTLSGYWKLRAGHYRIIYKIIRGRIEVLVVMVGMRRDFEVYRKMLQRLDRL